MADTQKFLDGTGVSVLWANIKDKFVAKKAGYNLSKNDFTDVFKSKLEGVAEGAEVNQNAFSTIAADGTNLSAQSKSSKFAFTHGDNITFDVDPSNLSLTINAKDTTYSNASSSSAGLMSADDKVKLDGVAATAQVNVIESIKVNGTAQAISGKAVDITVPTNNTELINGAGYQTAVQVVAAINSAIASVYVVKGSVDDATKLPLSGQKTGDVWNILTDSVYGAAGMNVVWNGTDWDALGSNITVSALTDDEIVEYCK